jgi:tRNA G18 (ribose-2'-O)-methylase SpoU
MKGVPSLSSLQASSTGVEFVSVSAKDMEMMSALKTAPGLLAVAHMPDPSPHAPGLWLYLDDINDPGMWAP